MICKEFLIFLFDWKLIFCESISIKILSNKAYNMVNRGSNKFELFNQNKLHFSPGSSIAGCPMPTLLLNMLNSFMNNIFIKRYFIELGLV